MSKAKRIILPTIIGVLTGITSIFFQPVYNIYRLQLNHDEHSLKENQDIWFEGIVFVLPNDLIARSYPNYNKDHLTGPVPEGLITEVKVYVPSDQKETLALEGIKQMASNSTTRILNIRKQGEVRDWLSLISWSIIGLFIGLLLNYIHFLFVGKPHKNKQKHS